MPSWVVSGYALMGGLWVCHLGWLVGMSSWVVSGYALMGG